MRSEPFLICFFPYFVQSNCGFDPFKLPKSVSLDNAVLPTNLRGFVDEADGCAHDDPLNEVSDGLVNGQREADVQVDIIVDREGADREQADECAEVYA
jgi:hypothetical protein